MRLKPSDIIMTTLQGEPQYIYGESFIVLDKEYNTDLINSLSSENPSSASNITTIKREILKL